MIYIYLISVFITAISYFGLAVKMRNMFRDTFKSHFTHYLRTYKETVDPPKISNLILIFLTIVVFPFNVLCSLIMLITLIGHDPSLQQYVDTQMWKYIQWCREHCSADFCDDLIVLLDEKEEQPILKS